MNASLALAALSGAMAGALFIAMQRRLGHLEPGILSLQLCFGETRFRRILDAWGPDGVRRFAAHFALDYPFLVSYAVFGLSFGGWWAGRLAASGLAALALPWLLPAAAVFDAVENMLHQRLVGAAPGSEPALLFVVAGLAAALKWLMLIGFPVLAVALAWGPVG